MTNLTDFPLDVATGDLFDWNSKADVLAKEILDYDVSRTGLTIGVQGDWGSGKTSFINLILDNLGEVVELSYKKHIALARKVVVRASDEVATFTITFDSWLMSNLPLSGMNVVLYLIAVLEDFIAAQTGKEPSAKDSTLQKFVDYSEKASQLVGFGGDVLSEFGVPLAGVASWVIGKGLDKAGNAGQKRLSSKAFVEAFRSIGSLRDDFLALVEQVRDLDLFADYDDTRLVVVIDDLDRLPPSNALQITEKLKLFLDVPHSVFIIGADLEVVARGLESKFGIGRNSEEKRQYMNKIVRLSYPVPRLTRNDAYKIMASSRNLGDSIADFDGTNFAGTFADELLFLLPNMGHNPRNLKKVVLSYGVFRAFYIMSLGDREPNIETYYRLLAIAILYQHNLELAKAFNQFLSESADDEPTAKVNEELCCNFIKYATLSELIFDTSAIERFFNKLASKSFTVSQWLDTFSFASAI